MCRSYSRQAVDSLCETIIQLELKCTCSVPECMCSRSLIQTLFTALCSVSVVHTGLLCRYTPYPVVGLQCLLHGTASTLRFGLGILTDGSIQGSGLPISRNANLSLDITYKTPLVWPGTGLLSRDPFDSPIGPIESYRETSSCKGLSKVKGFEDITWLLERLRDAKYTPDFLSIEQLIFTPG